MADDQQTDSGTPDKPPLGARIKAAFKRPITYVALLAVGAGIASLILSLNRDYGGSLPVYALELPFLLHLMHASVACLLVAAVGGVLVRLFRGDEPDQLGAGPLSVGVGRSSRKALGELRDAVAALRDRVDRLEARRDRQEASEVKGLPPGADGEGKAVAGEGPSGGPANGSK